MKYIETELVFISGQKPTQLASRSLTREAATGTGPFLTEILGITLRLGNQPLVYNLAELAKQSGKALPPAQANQKDNYLIVHAVSAIRTQGKAKVDELQYFATSLEPAGLQTIDLIPKTRFNEIIHASLNVSGTLNLAGETSIDVPDSIIGSLLSNIVDIGGNMKLQLSSAANFIGRFTFSVQIPVIQSAGIGSDSCSWILRPDEKKTPLLGDQLLVQSIAVPKGTRRLCYTISGLVKADKGIFWKQQEKRTADHIVEIDLDQINSSAPQA